MNNRINLKELSDILLKEVEKGNGDAYVFVGEYYASKQNHPEGTDKEPFIIYTDKYNKEKVAALSYIHVQKLTDEENLELTKRLELDKKSKKSHSKEDAYYRPSSYRSFARYEDNNDYYGNVEQPPRDQPMDVQEQPVIEDVNNNIVDEVVLPVAKKSRRVTLDNSSGAGADLSNHASVFYTTSFIGSGPSKKAKR